ncbi:arsenic resistance N-acetyltransferase ArsN2 [Sunxiuqinia sp. A32]|uniref:arsenic resistance N-acetyltransferase ArsN2 n=1 Tax=Sunxiuqinia sp. A32 TaxID=3461496 RepID=UPI0040466F93
MNSVVSLNNSEIPKIKNLLSESNLPTEDLDHAPILFYGIKHDESLLAVGALETYGKNAIIRSFAVKNDQQNTGLGKLVISFLENKAKELGTEKLFLLTTTAESYFRKLNYLPTNRKTCPPEIQESSEFSNLCPAPASCLSKVLLTSEKTSI